MRFPKTHSNLSWMQCAASTWTPNLQVRQSTKFQSRGNRSQRSNNLLMRFLLSMSWWSLWKIREETRIASLSKSTGRFNKRRDESERNPNRSKPNFNRLSSTRSQSHYWRRDQASRSTRRWWPGSPRSAKRKTSILRMARTRWVSIKMVCLNNLSSLGAQTSQCIIRPKASFKLSEGSDSKDRAKRAMWPCRVNLKSTARGPDRSMIYPSRKSRH